MRGLLARVERFRRWWAKKEPSLLLVLISLIGVLPAGMVFLSVALAAGVPRNLAPLAAAIAAEWAVLAMAYFIVTRVEGRGFRSVGFRRGYGVGRVLRRGTLYLAAALAATMLPLMAFNVLGIVHIDISVSAPPLTALTLLTLVLGLTAGFVEECLYRGAAISRLKSVFRGHAAPAVLISSLVFAWLHLGSLLHLLTSFLFALVASAAYLKERSIWPCIYVHCAVNVVALFVVTTVV